MLWGQTVWARLHGQLGQSCVLPVVPAWQRGGVAEPVAPSVLGEAASPVLLSWCFGVRSPLLLAAVLLSFKLS